MILVLGTVSIDRIETPGADPWEGAGGSALYAAAAAVSHGAVRTLGVVGHDYPAAKLTPLKQAGVDLGGLRPSPFPSQRWHARYDDGGHRETVSSDRRILEGFRPDLTGSEQAAAALCLGATDPAIQRHVLTEWLAHGKAPAGIPAGPSLGGAEAPLRGRLVALDSMLHWTLEKREILLALLPFLTVLFATTEELRVLADDHSPEAAARGLLGLGPLLVVEKRGARGARAFGRPSAGPLVQPGPSQPTLRPSQVRIWEVRAVPTEALDPSGAGDAFCGGFVGRWLAAAGPGHLTDFPGLVEDCLLAGAVAGAKAASSRSFHGLV